MAVKLTDLSVSFIDEIRHLSTKRRNFRETNKKGVGKRKYFSGFKKNKKAKFIISPNLQKLFTKSLTKAPHKKKEKNSKLF